MCPPHEKISLFLNHVAIFLQRVTNPRGYSSTELELFHVVLIFYSSIFPPRVSICPQVCNSFTCMHLHTNQYFLHMSKFAHVSLPSSSEESAVTPAVAGLADWFCLDFSASSPEGLEPLDPWPRTNEDKKNPFNKDRNDKFHQTELTEFPHVFQFPSSLTIWVHSFPADRRFASASTTALGSTSWPEQKWIRITYHLDTWLKLFFVI